MNLQNILNIKYPFIQGGMANITNGDFAADVSNAGGLGIITTGGFSPEELRENIRICKSKTNKPFGVNVIMMHWDIDEIAKVLVEEKVEVITTGAGNPEKYIDYWKNNNIKVFPVVSTTSLAIRMQRLGVDGIIAEGQEAGGHIGEATTMTLTPQIADVVNIPIISAGGIASGRQILASEVLGATGVQMGTVLLGTKECPIHDNYKEKLIKSKNSQVIVIGRINGLATRMIKNKMTREYLEKEKRGATKEELEIYTFGALRKSAKLGDLKDGSIMAGQSVEQIKEILPIKELFEKLYSEYKEKREKLCRSI